MSDIIKAEIKRLVELVNDQTKEILEYPDSIPLIEIDLVKESLRRLYQHINYLSTPFDMTIGTPDVQVKEVEETEEAADETDLQAEELMNEAEKQIPEMQVIPTEEEPDEEIIDKEEVAHETEVEEMAQQLEQEILQAVQEISEIPQEETVEEAEEPIAEEPIIETEIPAEAESTEESTPEFQEIQEVIEKPAAKEDMLLVDQIGKTTIKSLKEAIGINDKFQFVNELFDGSMSRYNTFIEKLDTAEDRPDALATMDSTKLELKWEKDNTAFVMLQDYVDRRF